MSDDKIYTCQECGQEFPTPILKAQHVKAEHRSRGIGVSNIRKDSFLTDEDISELREREKRVKELELQLKEAKLNAELKKLQTVDQPVREKTWVLPDGTSFQGSSADYRDMLQTYYQVQAINKKATTESENPTMIKAMLERIAELEKQLSETKMKDIESKIDFIANRDPIQEGMETVTRFRSRAQELGLAPTGRTTQDEAFLKKIDFNISTGVKAIDTIASKVNSTKLGTGHVFDEYGDIIKKAVEKAIDNGLLRSRYPVIPHTEEELLKMQQRAESVELDTQRKTKDEPKEGSGEATVQHAPMFQSPRQSIPDAPRYTFSGRFISGISGQTQDNNV